MISIRCSDPACAAVQAREYEGYACPACGDLLEIACESPGISPDQLKSLWCGRRASLDPRDRSGVWRFREFLPDYPAGAVITIGEGNTPLLAGRRSAEYAGVTDLRFKHLGWNPTGCFKDLGMTVAVTEAKLRGATTVACASTGNTAASLAAYAARAGLSARVYLPKGAVSKSKLAQCVDFGAEIVEIEGNFDAALDKLIAQQNSRLYFMNSINPFRVEGQKTVMFELMEQLNWQPPDYIVLPGGNLGNTAAFGKALEELAGLGLIRKVPRMIVVQARGANAFVRTVRSGKREIVEAPETRATAIRIGAPKSWKKALRSIAFTDGIVLDVSDDEIMEAKRVIGRDGIGCEPASATTVAGLRRLASEKKIEPGAIIVAILTGHALKDIDAIWAAKDFKLTPIK